MERLDICEVLKGEEYDFVREERRLGDNIMFLTFGGSYAYGTNGPESDVDIRGVTLPLAEDVLGASFLKLDEDVMRSGFVMGHNGFEQYNDKDTDSVIYGFDKAIQLLYKCNPNMIEMLGCREEDYAYVSEAGRLLLDNKDIFLSKLAIGSFSGYARQQFYRLKNALARDTMVLTEKQFFMINVIDRMKQHLEEVFPTFKRDFAQFYVTDHAGNKLLIGDEVVKLEDLVFTYKNQVVTKLTAKDFELNLNDTELRVDLDLKGMSVQDIAGVYNEVSRVLKDFTTHIGHRNRKKDSYHLNKHAMHLVRLYLMCFDILEKHEIKTYREEEHELLMRIKDGYYMREDGSYAPEFYHMIDEFEEKLKRLEMETTLPERPDHQKIQELVMQIKKQVIEKNVELDKKIIKREAVKVYKLNTTKPKFNKNERQIKKR